MVNFPAISAYLCPQNFRILLIPCFICGIFGSFKIDLFDHISFKILAIFGIKWEKNYENNRKMFMEFLHLKIILPCFLF